MPKARLRPSPGRSSRPLREVRIAMPRNVGGVVILLAAISITRAGQESPHEESLRQAVESFEKIGVTLKKITSEATAAAAKPELRKSADAFVQARMKAAKLPQPEKEEKLRLE